MSGNSGGWESAIIAMNLAKTSHTVDELHKQIEGIIDDPVSPSAQPAHYLQYLDRIVSSDRNVDAAEC